MNIHTLEDIAQNKVSSCLELATQYFGKKFHYSDICFKLRGNSAGQYVVTQRMGSGTYHRLRFNRELLLKYGSEFINEVVPHECAHLVVFQFYGKQVEGRRVLPHGKQWKHVMSEIYDLTPRIKHQFEVSRKDSKRFLYYCSCESRVHELSVIRHNKIMRGKARYLCKSCNDRLKLSVSQSID